MAKNAQQDEEIHQLKTKINKDVDADIVQRKSLSFNEKKTGINHEEADYTSPRLPPSSCRQLSTIGHYLDGIYLVANPDSNKIETVYCDFSISTLSETLYGSIDVKTKSVQFFVQRSTGNFSMEDVVVPFDTQLLNEGDAMNLGTGVFTVPVDGIYHFEFQGIKSNDPTELRIFLQANGINIGEAYATGLPNYLALSGIGASLRLKTGDQVRLYKTVGTLHDNGPFTQFTGWLVEENSIF